MVLIEDLEEFPLSEHPEYALFFDRLDNDNDVLPSPWPSARRREAGGAPGAQFTIFTKTKTRRFDLMIQRDFPATENLCLED